MTRLTSADLARLTGKKPARKRKRRPPNYRNAIIDPLTGKAVGTLTPAEGRGVSQEAFHALVVAVRGVGASK